MTPKLASDVLASTGADKIAVYDGFSPVYIIDMTDLANVTMQAGCGYWVHVNSDSSWNVVNSDPGNDGDLCLEPQREVIALSSWTPIEVSVALPIKIKP